METNSLRLLQASNIVIFYQSLLQLNNQQILIITLTGHEETSNVLVVRGSINEVEDKLVFKKLMTGCSTKYTYTFEEEGIRMRSFSGIGIYILDVP